MSEASYTVTGNSAIITGAGVGIGRRIARSLVDVGIDVVINDVDEDALADVHETFESSDGEVSTVAGDASDPDTASAIVENAVEKFDGLDIVVNNVGIAGPTKPCEEVTYEEFFETLEVNLGAMFATTSAAIPYLRRSDSGRVVNISSMSGKRPLRDRTPYTTSKMGVIGFTRTLAVELAESGVTVNAICPGSVSGERLERVISGQAESQGRSYQEIETEFRNVSPMNEFVETKDVANMVLYLCSEETRRITGQDLNVTAGITMH